jgi:hypothetical protein
MPKRRISGSRRQTSKARRPDTKNLSAERFVGVALTGGKTEKTSCAVLEYFPEHEKLFLAHLEERIKPEDEKSADAVLIERLEKYQSELQATAFNVPLSFPLCIPCRLKCPGYESCKQDHIVWLTKHYELVKKSKKKHRIFTPYTQRCADHYISHIMDEPAQLSDALGSNLAPLTARAHYLQRHLGGDLIEAFPRLSVWRLGTNLKVAKSHIKNYLHSVRGEVCRTEILNNLSEKKICFLYHQDFVRLVENHTAFEAFITALTAYLWARGKCENKPRGFPKKESWLAIPKLKFDWFK